MKIINDIENSPFKPLVRKYYFGKIAHGTPYFYPWGFCKSIINIRKLHLRSEEDYQKEIEGRPWLIEKARFSNKPMVLRCKNWTIKLFGNYYWIELGWPIKVKTNGLGWKDK